MAPGNHVTNSSVKINLRLPAEIILDPAAIQPILGIFANAAIRGFDPEFINRDSEFSGHHGDKIADAYGALGARVVGYAQGRVVDNRVDRPGHVGGMQI